MSTEGFCRACAFGFHEAHVEPCTCEGPHGDLDTRLASFIASRDRAPDQDAQWLLELLIVEAKAIVQPGLTCDEVEDITGMPHQSASPAMGRLRDETRFIARHREDDRTVQRRTRNGELADVYVLTETGRVRALFLANGGTS